MVPVFLVASLVCAAPAASRVELVFGGDVIPHDGVKEAARARAGAGTLEGWDFVLEPIAPVLRAADVAVVNLETPVSGDPRAPTASLIFDAPPALPRALVAAGVDLVTVANNHAFDQRRAGIPLTWANLERAGLKYVGSAPTEAAAWEPLVLESHGIRVGFLSLTRWLNGAHNPAAWDVAPQVAFVPYSRKKDPQALTPEAAAELVRAAARRCDALIVSVHWGVEYVHAPRPEDRALARALLDAGALAVIGHHPHVLQPVESYRTPAGRDTLVAFSLGNLLANQDWHYVHGKGAEARGRKRDSLLLRLSLERAGPGQPVTLAGSALVPVWIDNNHSVALRERQERSRIQPVLLDEEVTRLRERLQTLPAAAETRGDTRRRGERALLERQLDLAERRRALILRLTQPMEAPAAPPAPKERRGKAGARAEVR
ncbi:CapA family protein [Archangium primigenium]|uniref:CapA family protein n=1 Tax=[Archangium] primigenium TaxID=2792470 RepID=UPI001956CEFC|nr:CapA family protein [Archangium primigenium]MBM7111940.1 CapA family protein [Archangium primigenium]